METSAGCCHIAPSACITGPHLLNIATPHSFTPPALHVSTPPHTHTHVSTHTSPPLHFLLFLLFFVPSPLFSFPTSSPFPLLSPIILFTCLCHCVICFFLVDCASLPYSPPPPFLLLLWMDRDFVLTTGNAVLPYWPTNRKKSQTEMNPACLFF